MLSTSQAFIDVLHADRPAPDSADKLALYGFLVGSWEMEVAAFEPDGARHTGRGEIHAGWVLEGRAIQDVWMIPPRAERREGAPALPVAGNWYGTTLRIYDPRIDAWHILWSDPATQFYARQIGRAEGSDIVQMGKLESGAMLRWRFTDITGEAFHWIGEHSADDGKSWRLQVDILARRLPPA
jgi:hypothetical protein